MYLATSIFSLANICYIYIYKRMLILKLSGIANIYLYLNIYFLEDRINLTLKIKRNENNHF